MKTQFGASCFAILTALGLAACSGQIGDDVAAGGTSPGDTVVTNTMGDQVTLKPGEKLVNDTVCEDGASLAHARISLISDQQFINVVRDTFGVTLTGDISTVASANGEYNVSETTAVANKQMAQSYMDAASTVIADKNFKPCGGAVTAATEACMATWLKSKLPQAWRRPVTDADITPLMTIFNLGNQESITRAVEMTMQAVVSSPNFLYREELGDQPTMTAGKTTLTAYEVASALAFALTNSTPDATLLGKAADGSILQSDVLGSEFDRLLTLQSAKDNLQKKVSYYLFFEKLAIVAKDAAVFPEWAGIKDTLYQSSQMFLKDVLWSGTFNDLLTSRKMYANSAMAKIYNIPGVTSTALTAVTTTGSQYNAGVLTQPALLATSNKHVGDDDIVHRGLYLYYNMACGVTLADPPANAQAVFSTLTGTPLQKAVKRDAIPACGACHGAFDPFGILSENYDAIGRYRTNDPDLNMPINASTTIAKVGPDIDGPVADISAMAQKFLTGTRASNCAATQLTRFTLDHNADVENSCAVATAKDQFHTSGSFVGLFKSILTSPAFLTRDLAPIQ
jgi:hypothetical protein